MRAIWNHTVLAESDETVVVEGNHYFPPASVHDEYFAESETQSTCPWKGVARYRTIVVDGERNSDAACLYPSPKERAANIKDHLAFWKGVTIEA